MNAASQARANAHRESAAAEQSSTAAVSGLAAHRGWSRTFREGAMTLGFLFPIEAYNGDVPAMHAPMKLAQFADEAGFASLWVRDVPFRDPHFGDVGQVYDPWVFASWAVAHTRRTAIGTGSIILPLRPSADMAKASASLDAISGSRFLFRVASGDRPSEFPLLSKDHAERGADFRRSVEEIRGFYQNDGPLVLAKHLTGVPLQMLPTPPAGQIPLLVTGHKGRIR